MVHVIFTSELIFFHDEVDNCDVTVKLEKLLHVVLLHFIRVKHELTAFTSVKRDGLVAPHHCGLSLGKGGVFFVFIKGRFKEVFV